MVEWGQEIGGVTKERAPEPMPQQKITAVDRSAAIVPPQERVVGAEWDPSGPCGSTFSEASVRRVLAR